MTSKAAAGLAFCILFLMNAPLAQQRASRETAPLVWSPIDTPALAKRRGETATPSQPILEVVKPTAPVPLSGPAAVALNPAIAQTFCTNIADAAADSRFLAQKRELASLEQAVAEKTALLEQKRAELQQWISRRSDFIRKAEDSLARLYGKVKADAAAAQLAAMDEETAAALLMRLNERSATTALNEMTPEKAARLVSIIVDASKKPEPKNTAASATAPAADTPSNPTAGKPENKS